MDLLKQSVVDQRLVVPSPGLVHETPGVLQYRVIKPNRDGARPADSCSGENECAIENADSMEMTPRVIVLLPDEDDAGIAWASGIAKQWVDELGDSRQDIYTLEDGQPVNTPR